MCMYFLKWLLIHNNDIQFAFDFFETSVFFLIALDFHTHSQVCGSRTCWFEKKQQPCDLLECYCCCCCCYFYRMDFDANTISFCICLFDFIWNLIYILNASENTCIYRIYRFYLLFSSISKRQRPFDTVFVDEKEKKKRMKWKLNN